MEAMAPDRGEVRRASLRLPDRQRAALELREGKGLSYEQIAASLGTSVGSVAQLIERARINLYDELRGTALASIAAPSAECERALPLIAARQDGELASSSEDASWLDTHLSGCDRCRLATEQMGEAAAFYRGEAPRSAEVTVAASATGSADSAARPRRHRGRWPSRRRTALAGGLVGLAALGGTVAALVADSGSPDPAPSAADAATRRNAAQEISDARVARATHEARHAAKHATRRTAGAALPATSQTGSGESSATPAYTSPEGGGGSRGTPTSSPHGSGGDTAVQPAEQKSTPKPEPKPKSPSSSTQSQPAAPPASETTPSPPPAEQPTPAEEPPAEHGHKGAPPGQQKEPPGKS